MKLRIVAFILALSVAMPMFAHHDVNGIQITTKSSRAHMLFEQGVEKISLLHQEAGLELLRKSVKADPNFALAHIFIAFFSLDPAEQVAEREKAMATRKFAGPEEQLIIDWQSNASEAHWVPAIQAMNTALAQYPNDKYLHWMAGWWLVLSQNQQQHAITLFERVTMLDPKFPDAWNELAYAYAKTGNMDKAFVAIRHYTELVPHEANPQDSYAELSRMAGHFDEALKHYRKSLQIDPTFHESQLGLGDTFALMGHSQGSAVAISYAIRHPERVSHLILCGSYSRGACHRQNVEHLEARRALEKLVELNFGESNPSFFDFVTSFYIPEGATQQAQEWFKDLQLISVSSGNLVKFMRACDEINIRTLLPQVSVPTIVFHSDGDRVAPPEEGRIVATEIPHARFVPLASGNHLLLAEESAWKLFREELESFLRVTG